MAITENTVYPPQKLGDCITFCKVLTVPATASGAQYYVNASGVVTTSATSTTSAMVVSGGFLCLLGDTIRQVGGVTVNRVEITFLPVSSSMYDSRINASGYPFAGYAWLYPKASNMQNFADSIQIHPEATTATTSPAYGKLCQLGEKVVWDVHHDSNLIALDIYNRFGGPVLALINYSYQKFVEPTGSCGS